ncbi:hypothetical protein ES703_42288 [subsurface metagenome]
MLQVGQFLRIINPSAVELVINGFYFACQVVYLPFKGTLLVLQLFQVFPGCFELLLSGDNHVIFIQLADCLLQLAFFISDFKVNFLQLV